MALSSSVFAARPSMALSSSAFAGVVVPSSAFVAGRFAPSRILKRAALVTPARMQTSVANFPVQKLPAASVGGFQLLIPPTSFLKVSTQHWFAAATGSLPSWHMPKPNVHMSGSTYRTAVDSFNRDNLIAAVPDIDNNPEDYPTVLFETDPGDILVFHGLTLHSSSGNASTDTTRRALSLRFAGDDILWKNRSDAPLIFERTLEDGEPLSRISDECPQVWPKSS